MSYSCPDYAADSYLPKLDCSQNSIVCQPCVDNGQIIIVSADCLAPNFELVSNPCKQTNKIKNI